MFKHNKQLYFLLGTLLVIAIFFLPTINRGWQLFDEKSVYQNESLYPVPTSFPEYIEVVANYAFKSNIESQNLMFSNVINIRSNPIGTSIGILMGFLFKQNPVFYHLFPICIHLLNAVLAWLIFFQLFNFKIEEKSYVFPSLFSLIWALHPVNVEAVMMSTNWTALFTYTFSFGLILYSLKKLFKESYKSSLVETVTLGVLFSASILFNEYIFPLPFILFLISFAFIYRNIGLVKKSLVQSLYITTPYFIGLLLYFIYYIAKSFQLITTNHQTFSFSLERLLWFTPQIFIHFFKLMFFPKELSIFQSNLVHLAESKLDPYAMFTISFFLLIIIAPFILFLYFKKSKNIAFGFVLFYSFIFSLIPFLHIITPTYCVFAERYCYFPLFILLFIIASLITKPFLESSLKNKKIAFSLLAFVLILLSSRTIVRLQEWRSSESLYESTIKCFKDTFHKGIGYASLGYYYDSERNIKEASKYFRLSINNLESAIKQLKTRNVKSSIKTIEDYGLSTKASILHAAFRIASIQFYNSTETPQAILGFYESYIGPYLDLAGSSQLDLYAKLLLKTNRTKDALKILTYAKEKYPFSTTIIFSLSKLYLDQKNIQKAEEILTEGFYYYPNYARILPRMILLSKLKKDKLSEAKYEYLLGLRTHSQEAYQKSAQIYLSLGKINKAKKALGKLDHNNPITLLLLSKYYALANNNDKVFETLTKAYASAKELHAKKQLDVHIYESILLSLVTFNMSYNNSEEANKYIKQLEELESISKSTRSYIKAIREKLKSA